MPYPSKPKPTPAPQPVANQRIQRPRTNGIWKVVADFDKKGAVYYIAHFITDEQPTTQATMLGNVESDGGSKPQSHPDQQYWTKYNIKIRNKFDAATTTPIRIEIDCSLLPCGVPQGCLFVVPKLVREAGMPNMPLRIFSHRSETASAKKYYFDCNSSDSADVLIKKLENPCEWDWTP